MQETHNLIIKQKDHFTPISKLLVRVKMSFSIISKI